MRMDATGGKRSRRSWSDEAKQRIVAEAVTPGASVADVARRYTTATVSASAAAPAEAQSGATQACEFMPIGVFGSAADGASALGVGSSAAVAGGASSRCATLPRPGLEERPGVIEIDLADGVRLRGDAFVNERALRRVLAVLKVTS